MIKINTKPQFNSQISSFHNMSSIIEQSLQYPAIAHSLNAEYESNMM